MDTACEVSRQWLAGRGAPVALQEAVSADVVERLRALPDLLRRGVAVADTTLSVLPSAMRRRLLALPVMSEYADVVTRLTAVAYFDLLAHGPGIPQQRSVGASVDSADIPA